jgi:alpha-mannosidase
MTRTRVTLVPHTHWDREWYAPFDEFLQRLVQMMDGLIDLLDDGFPHFHLDGQTAMIDDYLAERPERAGDVARLAKSGKLSTGPWFTQMDEFLVSGESHIRNAERGLARAGELGGGPRIGYLPDQFGHVGQMPQILRSAGIDRAVVWRGVPREVERTQLWWEAPDGSRVLTEYLAFGYFLGGQFRDASDAEDLARRLREAVERLAPMTPGDRVLVMVGADHHGPDPSLPRRLAEASALVPELAARVGSLADHVEGTDPPEDLPVWRGELRSSARAHLLPNVYSARAQQKRERGRVESLVERYAEPLAALVPGFEWPAADLDRIWQLLLWNGAHDSACGCSHDQVGRDVDARFVEAHRLAGDIVGRALVALGEQVGTAGEVRFNPSTFERDGVPGLGWSVEPWSGPERPTEPLDLRVEGEWIEAGGVRFRLVDEPDVGDLYNFCPAEHARPMGPRSVSTDGRGVRVSFGSDLSVRLARQYRGAEPFVRLAGMIRSARPDHRLRLHVALPEPADRVVAGSPFELVERGLVSEGGDLEAPSPTWPARGAAMAGGVAVLHEGVFEYEVVDGRELAVTLQRAVGTISRQSIPTRPWPAGPDVPTPDAQMIGDMELSLAVMPAARREDLLPAWDRFALSLVAREAAGGGPLPDRGSLLEVSGAELSNVRRRDGAVEARVWNPELEPRAARVGGVEVRLGPARIETVRLP